jgi:uncharacterized 2Fe-2S/4Fe-4S cluster protein (DUF4445 family)
MIKINIVNPEGRQTIDSITGPSLLDILRKNGSPIYAPCGGKGTCGKCRVNVKGPGEVISCRYYPENDIDVILPGIEEANILVAQTKYLEDLPFNLGIIEFATSSPCGVAIDIGTTTVVLYFLNLVTGQIEKISSFLNLQKQYGADVISRINYCQENVTGLEELQESIIGSINHELNRFLKEKGLEPENIERVVVAGNTTMLHMFLGVDPISIALAPFKPGFTDKQEREGRLTGLNVNTDARVVTLPCISAYVGADILSGLTALKVRKKNYLFLDIGTNGEIALIKDKRIYTCATAAGPAFEGANISCGMGAISGALSVYINPDNYKVIGNTEPVGICGSGIVDIIAYMLEKELIDETGLLKETFSIYPEKGVQIIQQDIREIQLAKSAIYSGIKILMNTAGLSFEETDGLYLAGGFGNYISIPSAIKIGLLPSELSGKIHAVGNSAGIGALQYLKSDKFKSKSEVILKNISYIELSYIEEFTLEFAMNMDFIRVLRAISGDSK